MKSDNTTQLAKKIISSLKRSGKTLACAESITGGGLAAAITEIPGSSAAFRGGIVTYADDTKTSLLTVDRRVIRTKTAVSEEVAVAMAEEVLRKFRSDYAISTTGVAGPGKAYGQRAGTVWIAIAVKKGSRLSTHSIALQLSGDRKEVRHATIESALAAFTRILRA
jgi:nicotinamide-nucleotide amidase